MPSTVHAQAQEPERCKLHCRVLGGFSVHRYCAEDAHRSITHIVSRCLLASSLMARALPRVVLAPSPAEERERREGLCNLSQHLVPYQHPSRSFLRPRPRQMASQAAPSLCWARKVEHLTAPPELFNARTDSCMSRSRTAAREEGDVHSPLGFGLKGPREKRDT